MHTDITEKSAVKIHETWPSHEISDKSGDDTRKKTRFTRVTRNTNTVSVTVSDQPIPQQRVEVSMSLFGDEWSLPEVKSVEKRTRGKYADKVDDEEIEAAKFRYVAVLNGLSAWDSDEATWLHEILLEETNREMREAIENGDTESIQEKLAWYEDMTWRAFSFPVCCAIVGADPVEVLNGIRRGLAKFAQPRH